MKYISIFVLVFIVALCAKAQQFAEVTQPVAMRRIELTQAAGKEHGALVAIPLGLAGEVAATARDFATLHDKQWEILTFAQIGAASADAETSLYNLRHCASCQEIGTTRFVVGSRPDAHKYIVAGFVEITLEAVAGHYLRTHGPIRKWYWRYVWTLPQAISVYGHARASLHNSRVDLGCDPAGLHCY